MERRHGGRSHVRQWKVQYFDPGQGEAAGAHLAEFHHSAWIDVDVPGDVHLALMAAGVIEDPFYDRNEETSPGWRTRMVDPHPLHRPAGYDGSRTSGGS